MKIGYIRVSKLDQNQNRQIDELTKFGCERFFIDKASGVRQDRPEYRKMIDTAIRNDDTIVVTELSRLGRSLLDLIKVLEELKLKEVNIITLKEGINTGTAMGKAMYQIAGVFAEMEREYIIERTRSGLKAARARGFKGGRPKTISDTKINLAIQMHNDPKHSIADILKELNIKRSTFYKYLKESKTYNTRI